MPFYWAAEVLPFGRAAGVTADAHYLVVRDSGLAAGDSAGSTQNLQESIPAPNASPCWSSRRNSRCGGRRLVRILMGPGPRCTELGRRTAQAFIVIRQPAWDF